LEIVGGCGVEAQMESAIGGSKVHIAKYSKPRVEVLGESIQAFVLKPFFFLFWARSTSLRLCRALSIFVPEIDEAVVSHVL
jgi:hypothetical protein